jgi:hypothetical protein
MARLLLIYLDMCTKTTMTKLKPTIIERGNDMRGIIQKARIPKKRMVICLMAVLFTFLWAGVSFASWSQGFSENGLYDGTVYSITKIEVFDLGGNRDFESPGMGNFSAGSWTVQMPNTNYVLATNASTNTSNFNWLFYFDKNQNGSRLDLAYLAYTSSGQVFGTYLNRNSNTWTYPVISNTPLTLSQINDPRFDRTGAAVPIPPAVFLFSGGLLSLVALRKKIKA